MADRIRYLYSTTRPSVAPEMFRNRAYVSLEGTHDLYYTSTYSIKFVLSGCERYRIGKRVHLITSNHYLLVRNGTDVHYLSSPNSIAASVFMTPELIEDVFHTLSRRPEDILEGSEPLSTELEPFEDVYHAEDNIGRSMQAWCRHAIASKEEMLLGESFFYSLAEKLVHAQSRLRHQFLKLDHHRAPVRHELQRRLIAGRNFLLDRWNSRCSLDEVARVACLSPYHFHRLFRQVFGITPVKFHLRYRCERATQLLMAGTSVGECALLLGFADIHTFSKVYRRAMGVPPSSAIRRFAIRRIP
jgi:AraC-like DNA-binding protein